MTHHIVGYLISMAVGYWLLTLADKEKGFTKTLGKVLAGIIIVASLVGPLCSVGKALCRHSDGAGCFGSGDCSWGKGGMMDQKGKMSCHGDMEEKGMAKESDAKKDEGKSK